MHRFKRRTQTHRPGTSQPNPQAVRTREAHTASRLQPSGSVDVISTPGGRERPDKARSPSTRFAHAAPTRDGTGAWSDRELRHDHPSGAYPTASTTTSPTRHHVHTFRATRAQHHRTAQPTGRRRSRPFPTTTPPFPSRLGLHTDGRSEPRRDHRCDPGRPSTRIQPPPAARSTPGGRSGLPTHQVPPTGVQLTHNPPRLTHPGAAPRSPHPGHSANPSSRPATTSSPQDARPRHGRRIQAVASTHTIPITNDRHHLPGRPTQASSGEVITAGATNKTQPPDPRAPRNHPHDRPASST